MVWRLRHQVQRLFHEGAGFALKPILSAAVNVAAQTGASSQAAAAAQAAQTASGANGNGMEESIITVEVMGPEDTVGDEERRKRKQQKP
jgi:hypothetical protein